MYNNTNNQNQKFVRMMANNVGYFNKDVVIYQLVEFLKNYSEFNPQQTVRSTGENDFFSIIQLVGYVQIGLLYQKMCIGIPKAYPKVPPVMLLHYNQKIYNITARDILVRDKTIIFEKNEMHETYIRILLPQLDKQWVSSKTILNVYRNIIHKINNPAILTQKAHIQPVKQKNKVQNNIQPNIFSQQILDNININISDLNDFYFKVMDKRQKLQYNKSRSVFLRQYVPQIITSIKSKKRQIQNQNEALLESNIQSVQNKSINNFIDMKANDQQKIELLAEQQALREAEVNVRRKIENSKGQYKFGEYRKIVKSLYDRMFENQSNLLRLQN